MKIELREISIRDVVNGYLNNDEEGVVGYSGNLNIRPKQLHLNITNAYIIVTRGCWSNVNVLPKTNA